MLPLPLSLQVYTNHQGHQLVRTQYHKTASMYLNHNFFLLKSTEAKLPHLKLAAHRLQLVERYPSPRIILSDAATARGPAQGCKGQSNCFHRVAAAQLTLHQRRELLQCHLHAAPTTHPY